jgi:GNAT superfamily N-acetyltransferase
VTQLAGFRTRRALSDEHNAVLAVRREAYAGLAPTDQLDALITDEEDGAPNAQSYLLVAPDGRFAGTIRASISSAEFEWPSLRLSKLFPREMEKLLSARESIVQSARFGIVPAFRGLRLSSRLLRAVYASGIAFGADRLVSFVSARPTKLRSWNRIGWRTASEPIAYPLDPHGAVLVVGSIAEILQIARQSDDYRAMSEFVRPMQETGEFPEEV